MPHSVLVRKGIYQETVADQASRGLVSLATLCVARFSEILNCRPAAQYGVV